MTNVVSNQSPPPLFKEHNSLAIRIWHWLTFITITASIATVLLASTVFTIKDNVSLVKQQIQQKGGVVSREQARAVAHEYNDKFWHLHTYLGYGLCILLLSRVIVEIIRSKEQRLAGKIKKALQYPDKINGTGSGKMHYVMVKRGYLLFYLFFLIMAVTGLGMAYEEVPFLKSLHKALMSIHSFVQYLIYFFIIAHLVGVISADMTDNKGIVSGMINGGEDL